MIHQNRILAFIIALVGLSTACERNLEEEIPEAAPQLVVNSIFTHDSTWVIEVSATASPRTGQYYLPIDKTHFKLHENGTEVTDFYIDSTEVVRLVEGMDIPFRVYQFKSRRSEPEHTVDYDLSIICPGFQPISVGAQLPSSVMVSKSDSVQTEQEVETIGDREMRLYEFSIQAPSEGQYFAIEIINVPSNGDGSQKIDFFSTDEVFQGNEAGSNGSGKTGTDGTESLATGGRLYDTNQGIFFSNESFTDGARDFSIYVDTEYGGDNSKLFLRILTLSDDLYRYASGSANQGNGAIGPLNSSPESFSNVSGGYGIFAGFSTASLPLD